MFIFLYYDTSRQNTAYRHPQEAAVRPEGNWGNRQTRNPNIPNQDNVIPLGMMGAMPHRLDVLKKMLENGGDVHYKNGNSGMELLEFAKHYLSDIDGFKEVIELMEQYA